MWAKGCAFAGESRRAGDGGEKWSQYRRSINEATTNYFKCAALSQFKGHCWASTL